MFMTQLGRDCFWCCRTQKFLVWTMQSYWKFSLKALPTNSSALRNNIFVRIWFFISTSFENKVSESQGVGVARSRIPKNISSRIKKIRLRKSNWIIFYIALISCESLLKSSNFFWYFYRNRILAVYHDFHWLLVATKMWTAKLDSHYVKESETLGTSDSAIIPLTRQTCGSD